MGANCEVAGAPAASTAVCDKLHPRGVFILPPVCELVNLTNSLVDDMLNCRAMAKTVNLYEAKTHLSALVDRAADGEEIVIAKAGKPRARLVPVSTPHKPRRPGGGKGKVWVADDFDAPLPADLLAAFNGR